ncbi:hypothetical protein N9Z38_00445 [Mariniblastus sp.]|nr:hypothetical protein [Mariniblastus sp.]
MKETKTALVAKNMFGDELYQQRARMALPILVRQAHAQQHLTYKKLANEMGLPNARNLNYILGSVGVTVQELALKWGEQIPPIEGLVVNQSSGLPGDGFIDFLTKEQKRKPSLKEKRLLIKTALVQVYAYPKWLSVLAALKLKPLRDRYFGGGEFRGGGESERHKMMKEAVAQNPELLGLSRKMQSGETEIPIPSGDSLDVLFTMKSKWIAVEVKTSKSGNDDLVRGLYQCVKYAAVLETWRGIEGNQEDVRVILVLEDKLPSELFGLKNALGIEVIDELGEKLTELGIFLPEN